MLRHSFPALVFCALIAGCATQASPEDRQMSQTLSDQGKAFLATDQADEARDAYLSAVVHDDANARAWNGLGVAYDLLGHQDKAEEAYRRAVDLRPHDLMAVNNLAHLYVEEGNPAAAVDLLAPYAEDYSTPVTLRQNLADARKAVQDQQKAAEPAQAASEAFAELGSYPTEGMAKGRMTQAKALLGEEAAAWTFGIEPEVKVMGGTPVFTVKATGKDPQALCESLIAEAIPCVAQTN